MDPLADLIGIQRGEIVGGGTSGHISVSRGVDGDAVTKIHINPGTRTAPSAQVSGIYQGISRSINFGHKGIPEVSDETILESTSRADGE
jgi:hypothetical protein